MRAQSQKKCMAQNFAGTKKMEKILGHGSSSKSARRSLGFWVLRPHQPHTPVFPGCDSHKLLWLETQVGQVTKLAVLFGRLLCYLHWVYQWTRIDQSIPFGNQARKCDSIHTGIVLAMSGSEPVNRTALNCMGSISKPRRLIELIESNLITSIGSISPISPINYLNQLNHFNHFNLMYIMYLLEHVILSSYLRLESCW